MLCVSLRLCAFAACAALAASVPAAAAPPPNIVVILADDLGWGELGCYGQQNLKGDWPMKAPNPLHPALKTEFTQAPGFPSLRLFDADSGRKDSSNKHAAAR